jgi:Bacterial surface proteins containing Ig-like domains
MKTKSKRLSALLLAFVMVASLFTGQVLPAFAAPEPVAFWSLYSPQKTIYYARDEDSFATIADEGFLYADNSSDFADGKAIVAEKFGTTFFAYENRNVYYDLTGPNETRGNMICGGEEYDPTLTPVPAIHASVANRYLAGPFTAKDGEEFYYMDGPRGAEPDIQGIRGNLYLEGPESGTKTDIAVFYNTETGEIIPLSEYIAPGGEVPAVDKPKYPGETTTPDVTNVKLDEDSITVAVGATKTLTATVTPPTAPQTVSWKSSNEAVATVSNGVVTGRSVGYAMITATAGNHSDSCFVEVTAVSNPPIGPGSNGDYYESVGTPNIYEAVDVDGNSKTPNKEYVFDVSKDNTPHTGETLIVVKGDPDGKWYTETPAGIYHEVGANGNYDANTGKTVGTDGKIGSNDDKAVTKYGNNWFVSKGNNVFEAVTGPNAGQLVGGGSDNNPDTNPAKPIVQKEGKYLIGPMTDSENNTFYYGDPSTGNLDSESNALKGNDVIWYVGEGGGLTQTKPEHIPDIGEGIIDLGDFQLPVVTGDTPVSVWNMQLKFIADGRCWQILAIDKHGNCLIVSADAMKNEQLIQKGTDGRFLMASQRYSAISSTGMYDDSTWGMVSDYRNSLLNENMGTIFASLTDLKQVALPTVLSNEGFSFVDAANPARQYGCFALSKQEANTLFPNDGARVAKMNDASKEWWLRTTYNDYNGWSDIVWDGMIDGANYNYNAGIRPAMWVRLGQSVTVEKPTSSAITLGGGKIDLANLGVPVATGNTPLSVWNMQLKFVAEGRCWQILAVDKDGNCLVVTADAPKNAQLIQMNANGGYMTTTQRYSATAGVSVYDTRYPLPDFKTSVLYENMGEIYNKFTELKQIDLPVVYSNNGYSAVNMTDPARRFGCFALSVDEAKNLFPSDFARLAKNGTKMVDWWLRTIDAYGDTANFVWSEGYLDNYYGYTNNGEMRLAMWLDLTP